jgi:integrase
MLSPTVAILSAAFKDAVRWKRLSHNVCDAVKLPRLNQHEVRPLDQEQTRRLLAVAKGSPLECLLTLALVTGTRLGEILALRWSDISFEEKMLQVRHTVDFIQGHGYVETEPKTARSRRTNA